MFVGLVASAGTIHGLTLRGDGFALFAQGSLGQITQNTFDDPSADSAGIALSGPSTLINANTFVGDGVSNETAIDLRDGAAMVSDNTISGHHAAIFVTGSGPGTTSTPTIAGNTITGSHQVAGGTAGSGVASFGGANPTIAGNRVSAPAPEPRSRSRSTASASPQRPARRSGATPCRVHSRPASASRTTASP